jgi:6-phosphogluconolactonase (cycloisomerase 2 family)
MHRPFSIILCLLLSALLAACGGGGGDGDAAPYNPLWIVTETQIPTVVTTGSLGTSQFRGSAYCGDACPPGDAAFGYCPPYSVTLPAPPVDISWSNLTTGATGQAVHAVSGSCSCLFSYCFTSYSHKWVVYDSIPLALGENVIEAKVSDLSGNTATDSVTINHPSLYGPNGIFVDTVNNELFVGTYNNYNPGIVVYDRTDNGFATPKRVISGASTRLYSPWSLDMDEYDEILAVNPYGITSVTVHSRTADGDVSPLRFVSGTSTGLSRPFGIAVDNINDEIFVSNFDSNSVTVYSLMAAGDTAPVRTISGAATGLNSPHDVAIDKTNNEIFVANNSTNSITVYGRTSDGDAAPSRTISGAATGLDRPWRVVADTVNNELYVINCCSNSISVFALGANGNAAPVRIFNTSGDPKGVAVDTVNNELFVTEGEFSINVYPRTANGNVAPIRTIN